MDGEKVEKMMLLRLNKGLIPEVRAQHEASSKIKVDARAQRERVHRELSSRDHALGGSSGHALSSVPSTTAPAPAAVGSVVDLS